MCVSFRTNMNCHAQPPTTPPLLACLWYLCSLLGVIGALQMLSLLMCVHLLMWRKWPPYVTKNVNLVVIAVSGLDVVDTDVDVAVDLVAVYLSVLL